MKKIFAFTSGIFLLSVIQTLSNDASKVINNPISIQITDNFISYVPDEIVLKVKSGNGLVVQKQTDGRLKFTDTSLVRIAADFGIEEIREHFPGAKAEFINGRCFDLSRFYRIRFLRGLRDNIIASFKANPSIESAEAIPIMPLCAMPNDPDFSKQWHLNRANDADVDAPEAWNIETGDATVVVAILDSGVRYYHKDLGGSNASSSTPANTDGNVWINGEEKGGVTGVDDDHNGYVDDWVGWDFVTNASGCWPGEDCNTADNDPRDFNGHGTHCAGIASAINNNGYGVSSPAGGWGSGYQQPEGNGTKIMSLRIGWQGLDGRGYVDMGYAAEAFYYAGIMGARIASCSWTSSYLSSLEEAIGLFLASGGIICVAAGNDNSSSPYYINDIGDNRIISVAALDTNGCRANFSNYGSWVDISAPGTNIWSTYHDYGDPTNDYTVAMSGTSMATPLVASVVALLWSRNLNWTAAVVVDSVLASTDSIYGLSCNDPFGGMLGTGRVNAYKAVSKVGTPCGVIADFSGAPDSGSAPLMVNFSDLSTGGPVSWWWTFGDSSASTERNPSYEYTAAGTYKVTLKSSSATCSSTKTKTGYVVVTSTPGGDGGGGGTKGKGIHHLVTYPIRGKAGFENDCNFGSNGVPIRESNGMIADSPANDSVSTRCMNKIPTRFELGYNRPNPFNPTTTIEMNLPVASDWTITIYNIAGQRVDEFSGYNEAGTLSVVWDASRYASGVYFYKAQAGAFAATKKMVLLK